MESTVKRILITGAGGFIGAHLLHTLLKTPSCLPLGLYREHFSRLQQIPANSLFQGDLFDQDRLRHLFQEFRPQVVIHAAAYGAYTRFEQDWQKMIETNLLATLSLLDLAREFQVQKFIHLGSSSEYGKASTPWTEDAAIAPLNFYGQSKAMATWAVLEAGKKGLPVWVIRPFSVYGPGEDSRRIIPALMHAFRHSEPFTLQNPNDKRDFIFIEDVSNFLTDLALAADEKGRGEIFNLASGHETALKELIPLLQRISGELGHIILAPQERPGLPWQGENSKMKSTFSFSPQYTLAQGLALHWQATL